MSNLAVPPPVFPEANRILNVGLEKVAKGTLATSFLSMPVNDFDPTIDVHPIHDDAVRGSNTDHFDAQQGPMWVEGSISDSPLYGDTICYVLAALFGEWTTTGTAGGTTWTATGGVAAGPGPITVSTGTAATAGTYIQITSAGSAYSEVVKVGTGSTTTSIVIDATTPIRFSYTGSTTITLVTGPYTRVFAVMNPASPTGLISAQGPSLSIIDRNWIGGNSAYYADAYPYCNFTEVVLTGMPNGYLTWQGKFVGWPLTSPGATVVPSLTGVRGMPAWRGSSTIAGTQISNVTQWKLTLSRDVEPIPAINGQQAPLVFSWGPLTGTFDLDYGAVSDETALNYMINNTQPSLLWTTANGGSGTSNVSFSVAAQLGSHEKGSLKPVKKKNAFGYSMSGTLLANSTNVGPSGGFGPAAITVINNLPVL